MINESKRKRWRCRSYLWEVGAVVVAAVAGGDGRTVAAVVVDGIDVVDRRRSDSPWIAEATSVRT